MSSSSLNTAQREAVETLSGPLLVLAGAGTGKTRVVTYRIARLIRNGVQSDRILGVTFTNKAAREMHERLTAILANNNTKAPKPTIATFHSHCVAILRRHIERIGYPRHFAICARGEQESLAREALSAIKVNAAALKPAELLSIISSWKSHGLTPDTAADKAWSSKHHLALLAYRRYETLLQTRGAVDFDNILLLTERLFREHHDVRNAEAGLFDHLLIDEYQDTNLSQYNIVRGLAAGHRNLCVVGDDDQSIYGWRGAEVTHILNFRRDYPEAKVVRLEANYRSTVEILQWANRVIEFNKQRHRKRLVSDKFGEQPRILACSSSEQEAETVVASIAERMRDTHRQPHDFAILFRTNTQPRLFEMELRKANIPYSLVGGQSFFDRKEIRDLLSYLRVINRPHDDIALLRILNTPPRGIGATSIQKLMNASLETQTTIWSLLGDLRDIELSEKTITAIGKFRDTITQFRHKLLASFCPETIESLVTAIDYRSEIARQYPSLEEQASRWESVGELVSAASQYIRQDVRQESEASLVGFLDSTSLEGNEFRSEDEKKRSKNAVALMTLHAAKGLEFPEVYLVGLEEGILPHYRSVADSNDNIAAVDEERRLCYVGITRAQQRLTLTMAKEREKWGKMRPTIPSRFLFEITGQTTHPHYAKAIAGEPGQPRSPSSIDKRR